MEDHYHNRYEKSKIQTINNKKRILRAQSLIGVFFLH